MSYEEETTAKKMKTNPVANEERLRIQLEKRQKYQQRVKVYLLLLPQIL